MLYKYANVSVLESECRESAGPAPVGALPSAGSIPPEHSHFCLFFLSLDLVLSSILHWPPLLFLVLSRRDTKIVLFLSILQYWRTLSGSNISMHKGFIVRTTCPSSPLCNVVLKALKFSRFVVHCAVTRHPQSELLMLVRK